MIPGSQKSPGSEKTPPRRQPEISVRNGINLLELRLSKNTVTPVCGHSRLTSQKNQNLTSQLHRGTRLLALITCEHAAKSWGSTTSISLSYRLAKSRAISPLASPRSLNGARRLGQRGAPCVGRRRRRRRRLGLGIGPGGTRRGRRRGSFAAAAAAGAGGAAPRP